MSDWSEGSVLVILGIACENNKLMLKGFKLIHEDGHELAPKLMSLLHERFEAAKVIESHDLDPEEQVLELIPLGILDLENRIEDSKVVEAFLAEISKGG